MRSPTKYRMFDRSGRQLAHSLDERQVFELMRTVFPRLRVSWNDNWIYLPSVDQHWLFRVEAIRA